MKPGFRIICRHSAGNMHVRLYGDFNGMCAWELIKVLRRHAKVKRVFVNMVDIRQVTDDGVSLFRAHMTHRPMRRDWLYFKGKKGFSIAPNGSRVLICHKTQKFSARPPRHDHPPSPESVGVRVLTGSPDLCLRIRAAHQHVNRK